MQIDRDRNIVITGDCDYKESFLEYDDEIVRIAPTINLRDSLLSSSLDGSAIPLMTVFPPESSCESLPVRNKDTTACIARLEDISTWVEWIRKRQYQERRRKRMAIIKRKRLSGEISVNHCQRKYQGLQNHAKYRKRNHGRFVGDDAYVDA